jgi:tetrahydromethanopterin S-methyltransferase subunit G
LISYGITGAIFYGWAKSQITQLSRRLDQHDDVRERLARIEEKLDFYLKHLIK